MRVAIITDQHFGVRGDSIHFLDYYEKFYKDTFFPKLLSEGVDTLLVLGDTFDHRKSVNFNSLDRAKSMFFDVLRKNNILTYILVGNHDTYFKNTNKVNSPTLLLGDEYPNIFVITDPTTLNIGDVEICMMPWICPENLDESKSEIETTTAKICMGHFEIAGFAMHRGMESEEGMDPKSFNKFELVFSGHYHHKSNKGNIHYLGNPAQLTWSDYNDDRGFHILDLDTIELEFVINPNIMFFKLTYDDTIPNIAGILDKLNYGSYTNKFVKVIVNNKTNPVLYDQFVTKLYEANPLDVNLIEDGVDLTETLEDDTIDEAEDTITIINKFVDAVAVDGIDPSKIKHILREIYVEALNTECT
jgi:DNA repair exonuclease SbcCD nuclease subunit